jgi:hypothetical protein
MIAYWTGGLPPMCRHGTPEYDEHMKEGERRQRSAKKESNTSSLEQRTETFPSKNRDKARLNNCVAAQ